MRYFYDFEFLEDGRTIDPISVGVVAEDGREYYAVFGEIEWRAEHDRRAVRVEGTWGLEPVPTLHERICAHDWLMANVVPNLPLRPANAYYTPVRPRSASDPRSKGVFDLDPHSVLIKPRRLIRNELLTFLRGIRLDSPYLVDFGDSTIIVHEGSRSVEPFIDLTPEPIELWGYFAAYDHVLLAQVLGGPMKDLPPDIPFHTLDLKQEIERLGVAEQIKTAKLANEQEHHALADARWNAAVWRWLRDYQDQP